MILLASEIFNFNLGKKPLLKTLNTGLVLSEAMSHNGLGARLDPLIGHCCSASLWWEHKYAHNPWL